MRGTEITVEGPTAAERARTLAFGIADGVLVAPGVPYAPVPAHTTDRDGRPLLLVQTGSPIATALRAATSEAEPDMPATLRISDVAPVTLADRVRGRAWLHGWLSEIPDEELRAAAIRISHAHPRPELLDLAEVRDDSPERNGRREWTILALEVAQVEIDDSWGSATLEPEEYAAAAPDPFVAVESGILTHLDGCHRDELTKLLPDAVLPECALPDSALPESAPSGLVRPLALDRYGLWVRCRAPKSETPGSFDLRLPFAEPVSDLHGLRHVYRRLFARATP
ncbi:hypothetical protein BZB76_2215 [Actinomadura pelletieri DSM 43383]|uniref:DUF2470 domain-containing protein n=1 Tax=Actinomadura pelletieri DSM 43383 TaxID=1120940 RepID=A0A495QTP2_9ACTN|nr:DUF2470 domain-containing protein [Actinomadura pelletieri]RKS76849.1 hypothetical protein BZB76_2215 [Actinomadura pelletieri DSM 43383]